MPGTMAGMPKKPVPSTDELARMLWLAEAKAGDVPRKRRPLIPDAVTAQPPRV
jgi:hypothetical protein